MNRSHPAYDTAARILAVIREDPPEQLDAPELLERVAAIVENCRIATVRQTADDLVHRVFDRGRSAAA